ncbi:hypothetical protein [Rhodospirillum rubrum]|uniref:Uncharacterized protein n=1 Tax=Rhodospirillum rubrum (strain ATCC 11170 / ATH 1.1.1 / DSM 467 / LMG 4362 / NCIMB 8255 / S1) TaxID=269796 RepID=Q2RR69_RHORT|nr:hypothetical protein [Rhodospirillum rubrum]ABC23376.1 hypothetical protein Rru_A2579 [Rhodospirillum rubrum ATCC 11170]AEO49111.1 hypothetical protein F11_13245 [Rhodospirillum rubrum F11]MBK5955021.1 hypothetical protein [Rhodospirillum rubrum]QXG79349.1 hypothetical protein KUL73_13305 [Rhodospirillum rubrum]
MSDTLTRLLRALQEPPRPPAAEPERTAAVNADAGGFCAGALVPVKRVLRDPSTPAASPEKIWTEVARETRMERVTASDGSGAWVDVERAVRVSFRDGAGRRMSLVFTR